MKIYSLYIVPDRAYTFSFDDDEIDFFDGFLNRNFNGQPIPCSWVLPKHSPYSERFPLYDFIMGYTKAPFVSQKVYDVISSSLEGMVEFWPIGQIKQTPYYIFNVLNTVDLLDEELSTVTRSENGDVLCLSNEHFHEPSVDPVVFKVPQDFKTIYVTQSFADLIISHRLTGIGIECPESSSIVSYKSSIKGLPFT